VSLHELRKCGVTLHLLIDKKRQPIPDAKAIYFVRPTEENVRLIADVSHRRRTIC
jgi:hypothetical protein